MSRRRYLEGLPYAPWHHPKERHIGGGVYVTTEYVDHYVAGLLYAAWRRVRGEADRD